MSHAIVDGLTPAHHYPYEEKLTELRGENMQSRDSIKDKIMIPGDRKRDIVKNNWKMWGPKGLMSTHGFFELGVASLTAPMSLANAQPTMEEIRQMYEIGIGEMFKRRAREIAVLDMYSIFYRRGWTMKLMIEVRTKLLPLITQTVTTAWYLAMIDAGLVKVPKSKKV